jgi:hypothetical protein
MVIFTQEYLKYKRNADGSVMLDENDEPVIRSRLDLEKLLAAVECGDASIEDKKRSIEEIRVALNGGVRFTRKDILEDIKACLPDDIDKGDN